jgi:hypothetical protein
VRAYVNNETKYIAVNRYKWSNILN